MRTLTSAERRALKGRAQRLEPAVRIGKQGLTTQVVSALDAALRIHDLVKVRFDEFKEQRREWAPQLAAQTGSQLVTLIGHVAVLYRPKAAGSSAEPAQLQDGPPESAAGIQAAAPGRHPDAQEPANARGGRGPDVPPR